MCTHTVTPFPGVSAMLNWRVPVSGDESTRDDPAGDEGKRKG